MVLPKQQQLTLLTSLNVTIFIFLGTINVYFYFNFVFPETKIHPDKASRISLEHLINTEGCVLPRTHFIPKGFHMLKDYGPNCSFEKRIATINDQTETLELTNETIRNLYGTLVTCEAYNIHHISLFVPFRNDSNKFTITKTTPLNISDKELVVTKCGRFVNFDAHFPLSSKYVRDKISFWNNNVEGNLTPRHQMPISVLFLGFDSTSRSQFHRSLQKTLPLLKRMGFIDFKGFHSIAPHTLDNFFPFLMGHRKDEPQLSSCPARKSGYDNCPIIWKDFDLNNFLTMFAEDGKQTFRYGARGFFKKPTDYCLQPLFLALESFSSSEYANNRTDAQCPSSINSPNFLLDYTKRFLQKFMHTMTPFFAFTWFTYPFHDNTYSLYGLDDKIESFFQYLNSEKSQDLRERTLIILSSDHGERFGDIIKKGYYEGFIERVLPGLFIRLPENLLLQFPQLNLKQTLQINSQRLMTGYDIHHTLLHLLKLQGFDIFSTRNGKTKRINRFRFNPVLHDRSSLFLPLSDHRTCNDINIPTEYCLCLQNTTTNGLLSLQGQDSVFKENKPEYTQSLVQFAIEKLNAILSSSQFVDACETHGTLNDSFVSWHVLYGTEAYTSGVLRFLTNLNRAEFDVQLKILHGKDIIQNERIQAISSFNRLNSYGNASWCIISDKTMKEFCHCKVKQK